MASVALAGRGDGEAVPDGRDDLDLDHQSPELCLGLRAGEAVAASLRALAANHALDAPRRTRESGRDATARAG